MMRKVSQEEIHRIRMCNARIRNQNHLLRCTLRNITTNPYTECGRVLNSVIHHCTKKKCETKSGEPDITCCPETCCRTGGSTDQPQQTRLSSSPLSCNRFVSSPTYTSSGIGGCSKPFCNYCRPSGYSYPYSKFYNRTNSNTISQPLGKPSKIQQSPGKPRVRSAGSGNISCKSETSCLRSVPSQPRSSKQRQPRGVAAAPCKNHGCLASTTSEPLPRTCGCGCCGYGCCSGTRCNKSIAATHRNTCTHHKCSEERSSCSDNEGRELSPQDVEANQAAATERLAEGCARDKPRPGCSVEFEPTSCRSHSLPSSCPGTAVNARRDQTNNRKDHRKHNSVLINDNESSAMNRPCAKILGELAFQLERRILDYVFGMEGHKRRRFYGYTVNNICQMMNKESKNVCGSDDPLRKSELAFRLQKLLTGLKKVGYNIKVHGDFAQQMVNTYGLLPCPPDASTIRDFGLHNANCIASLINHLTCDHYEKENLHILLNSLKYLSKCDNRPLFVW